MIKKEWAMNKTPRTDAEIRLRSGQEVVLVGFARQLETELAEARAEIERLKKVSLEGMNNARRLSGAELKAAQRLRAESSPEALESERAANAVLTEELERKDNLIEQMREALEIGLDSTRELLHEFDKKYGRTIEKNRRYTERWEAQIKQIEAALEAANVGAAFGLESNNYKQVQSAIDLMKSRADEVKQLQVEIAWLKKLVEEMHDALNFSLYAERVRSGQVDAVTDKTDILAADIKKRKAALRLAERGASGD